MNRPLNNFRTLPRPKNSPLWPQKVKKQPQNQVKSKVRIEGTIENKSCLTA